VRRSRWFNLQNTSSSPQRRLVIIYYKIFLSYLSVTVNFVGKLNNNFIGVPIIIKDTKHQVKDSMNDEAGLVNEVKRLGLLIDRYVDLELRIGDHVVIYIQRASA
jgi:hypothetical protein